MGTRNLTVVVVNNEVRVAQYCQWDGYISGQGVRILDFLKNQFHSAEFKKKVLASSWLTQEEHKQYWVDCGADPNSDMVTFDVSDTFKARYPHLHRDCGYKILELIQQSQHGLKIQNSIEFAADSLFCEYAYIIDLDKNTFEVYKGFNKEPLSENERFTFLNEQAERGYYPVKLAKSYNLSDLPSEKKLLEDCEEKDE